MSCARSSVNYPLREGVEQVLSRPGGPTPSHGQAPGLPGVPVTCPRSKTTAYMWRKGPQDAFAQIPNSVLLIKPIVSNKNWKDFCTSHRSHQSFLVSGLVDVSEIRSRAGDGCPGLIQLCVASEGQCKSRRPCSQGPYGAVSRDTSYPFWEKPERSCLLVQAGTGCPRKGA